MLLSGCQGIGTSSHPRCPVCHDEADLVQECPCCGVAICDYCGEDAESTWESNEESSLESGYSDGYHEGYRESYSEWYGEGYDDGTRDGYGQGYADALMGKAYDFTSIDGLVYVPLEANTFHHFGCSHALGKDGEIYWIEEALVLGYQYCPDCIGK